MKKFYLIPAFAAVMMTGCSQSEIVEQAHDAQTGLISFSTHVNKGTRAISNDSFNKFFVYGSYKMPNTETRIVIFSGENVNKSGENWTYGSSDSDQRYWISTAEYNFAAYGVDNNALPTGANANHRDSRYLNITDFLCNGSNQKDLVYATASRTATETGNPTVPMDFKHVLSRIKFVFKNSFPAGYKIKISDFKVINVRDKGNFYGSVFEANSGNPWENPRTAAQGEYTEPVRSVDMPEIGVGFTENNDVAVSGNVAESDAYYVIPFKYTVADVHLVFKLAVTKTEDEAEVKIFDKNYQVDMAPDWKTGHQYRYTIELSGSQVGLEQIKFSGTVSEWTEWENENAGNIGAGNLPSVSE